MRSKTCSTVNSVCTVLSQLNCESQQYNAALWHHSSTVTVQYSRVTSQLSFLPSQRCKWHQYSIMVFHCAKPVLPGDITAACANAMLHYDITDPPWHQVVPLWCGITKFHCAISVPVYLIVSNRVITMAHCGLTALLCHHSVPLSQPSASLCQHEAALWHYKYNASLWYHIAAFFRQ